MRGMQLLGMTAITLQILYSDPTHSIAVIWVKIFKSEKTIEMHLVRLTEVCGKVLSEKNG